MLRKHYGVELDVEADLQDPCRFQQRAQRVERVTGLDLVRREAGREQAGAIARLLVAERDIAGVVGPERQRNPAHLGLHRIDRCRLGVDGDMAGIVNPSDPRVEIGEGSDGLVLVAIDRRFARRLRARSGEGLRSEGLVGSFSASNPRFAQLGAFWAFPIRFTLGFGWLISPVGRSWVSRSPYSAINSAVALAPSPGPPGTFPVEPPASACTSATFSGGTPNF